jgi:hypothetical protein
LRTGCHAVGIGKCQPATQGINRIRHIFVAIILLLICFGMTVEEVDESKRATIDIEQVAVL